MAEREVIEMRNFPDELLLRLLSSLDPLERLKCSLVCRRWLQLLPAFSWLEDVQVVIRGADLNQAVGVLRRTQRQYKHLSIIEANLDRIDPEFWANIGRYLRDLELIRCTWTPMAFYTIILQCPKLEFLMFSNPDSSDAKTIGNASLFELPDTVSLEALRVAFSGIKHVSPKAKMSTRTLERLLDAMPNLESISAGCYDGKPRRNPPFLLEQEWNSDMSFLDLLSDDHVTSIADKAPERLRDLRLGWGGRLTRKAFEALSTMSNLRLLDIFRPRNLNNDYFAQILLNCTKLEHLSLRSAGLYSGPSFKHLPKLKELRRLSLFCFKMGEEHLPHLANLPTLQHLQLNSCDFGNDFDTFLGISRLPKLRSFELTMSLINPDWFVTVADEFRTLVELCIKDVDVFTNVTVSKIISLECLRSLILWGPAEDMDSSQESGSPDRETVKLSLSPEVELNEPHVQEGQLSFLDLNRCRKIRNSGLVELLRGEPQLQIIRILNCSLITNHCLEELKTLCPLLERLTVEPFADEKIEEFAQLRPLVEVRGSS
ncbi:uncharacterized protein LOC100900926 [Galendromus occidentalis]|uniref:Uncharacterized protein LOC100900926 n=1 Tax=Galendromus occidentalis TaxID=34638 RepID=A0AAJ6QSR8_9ACAR|nr:uncharacterized protein LOC100900926 [Galendromus occidentalis]